MTNLTNVKVSNMRADGNYGGAIYGQDSRGVLNNVTFFNCSSAYGVGAFFVQDLDWRFEDVTFMNSTSPSAAGRSDTVALTTWRENTGAKVVFAGDIKFINGGKYDLPALIAFTDSNGKSARNANINLLSDPAKPANFYFENYPNYPFIFRGDNLGGNITFEAETITVVAHRTITSQPKLFHFSKNVDYMSITVNKGIFADKIGLINSQNKSTLNVPNGPIIITNSASTEQVYATGGQLTINAADMLFQSSKTAISSGASAGTIVITCTGTFEIAQTALKGLSGVSGSVVNITASQVIFRESSPSNSLLYGATSATAATYNIKATCTSGSCGSVFTVPESSAPSSSNSDSAFTALPSSNVGILFSQISGRIMDPIRFANVTFSAPGSAIVFERNNATTGGALYLSSSSRPTFETPTLVFSNNTATTGGAIYAEASFANVFENVPDVRFLYNNASTGCALSWVSGCPALVNSAAISFSGNMYPSQASMPSGCSAVDDICYDAWEPIVPPVEPVSPPVTPPVTPPMQLPPPPGCAGAPPSSSATCQNGVWIVPAADFISAYTPPPASANNTTPIAPPPPIESPVIIVGNATVSQVKVAIRSISAAAATTANTAFISSNSCLIIDQLSIDLDDEAVATIEVRSQRVNLIESACTVQTVLTINASKPKKRCSKLDSKEIRTTNTLAATFQVSTSKCNLWWIILVSVLGGVILACLVFLVIYRASPKARKRIQPYFSSNT
jgi:predicted outer membrane repeat protein